MLLLCFLDNITFDKSDGLINVPKKWNIRYNNRVTECNLVAICKILKSYASKVLQTIGASKLFMD